MVGEFLTWLRDRGLTLEQCGQSDFQAWLEGGKTTRRQQKGHSCLGTIYI